MENLRTKIPFGRNSGIHKDQKTLVNHSSRRHGERMECLSWEGIWTRDSQEYDEEKEQISEGHP